MIFTQEFMGALFAALEKCKGLEQREDHHPEKDVLEHCLQTFHVACRESVDIDLILAALLHDVGKAVESYGHEDYSVDILSAHLTPKALWLIKNHMRVWTYLDGSMRKLSKVKELSGHPWFADLVCLARFDKMGRNPNKTTVYDRRAIIDRLNRCVENRFAKNKAKEGA
jgi:exopolyphosphatase/pppGpp-phosphohydrolase